LPNCDKCPIFSECPVYARPGKRDPGEDCPFLKLIEIQKSGE